MKLAADYGRVTQSSFGKQGKHRSAVTTAVAFIFASKVSNDETRYLFVVLLLAVFFASWTSWTTVVHYRNLLSQVLAAYAFLFEPYVTVMPWCAAYRPIASRWRAQRTHGTADPGGVWHPVHRRECLTILLGTTPKMTNQSPRTTNCIVFGTACIRYSLLMPCPSASPFLPIAICGSKSNQSIHVQPWLIPIK